MRGLGLLSGGRRRLCNFAKSSAGLVDVKVSASGLFSSDSTVLRARIFDTPTGHALLESCPHQMMLQHYGAEVYGPLGVRLPSTTLQSAIPPGGLAYSEQGNYLCVFWGAAPAWPVDYIGQIDAEWEKLRDKSWTELKVVRVAEEDEAA